MRAERQGATERSIRLRHSDPAGPGIRRRRCGRGFRYLGAGDTPVRDPETLARIKALVIPPAWEDVWICAKPGGHIQAVGTDSAGRRQYRYHDLWRERRDRDKHDRVLEFGRVLLRLREEVSGHEQLLATFERAPAASGTNDSLLAARKEMAETLVIEASKHEAIEEMYFWPAVRKLLPDGDNLADQAISQEQEGKEVLARLDKLDADNPEFDRLLGEFIKAGRDHIAFEETKVWPALRAVMTETESFDLGDKLAQGKKNAPTRPHPHTPAAPGVLKTAGPVAAAADRARDAATGRGRA